MKFLLIYGPPAAGKFTVANEIAKISDFKVFQNHNLIGSVASVFGFKNPEHKKIQNNLTRKFRLEIFKEAAKENINLITTYGGSSKSKFEFFNEIYSELTKLGVKAYFVHLIPSKQAILERVESPSRIGVKIDSKAFLSQKLQSCEDSYYEKFPTFEHLEIDNSNLEAKEAAKIIIKKYKL